MDKEFILSQFETIEKKVEKLIAICKSLEKTNLELRNKIGKLEEDLQSKVLTENSYTEERTLIRSKIDNLLVKLKQVENIGEN
ncbi:MAG: DUF904 domain-containing protein [Desulfobacterales bacterium]|nr:DUF904 domain-containing protein [Desulfobacterales bacterium]